MFYKICVYSLSLLALSNAAMANNPADIRLFNKPKVVEAAPSVAINPKNPSRMIVTAVTSEGCKFRTSGNGGKTWSAPRVLPFTDPAENCRDVKIAYAPDGSRLYAAFLDAADRNDLFFTTSRNEGKTWSSQKLIMNYSNVSWDGGVMSINKIMTPLDAKHANWIYVITSVDSLDYDYRITKSANFSATWNDNLIYRAYFREGPTYNFAAFAAGPAGNIAVASLCNGCINYDSLSSALYVQYSRNFGSTFFSVYMRDDTANNWGQPFSPTYPSVALSYGIQGVMHIVYPSEQAAGKELRYTWSKAPYKAWASPEFVASAEPNTRSFSLQASNCGTATTLHLAWAAQRPISTRTLYDIVYSQRAASVGGHWSAPSRISNAPSKTSTSIVALAAEKSLAFAAWEDRRDGNMSDLDVFGSIVPTGLHCR